jgi:hypothetical protein
MSGTTNGCKCVPLYRSMDGGATWETTWEPLMAGNGGFSVQLPPAYPEDPRILLTNAWDAGTTGCLLSDFHSTSCVPVPLFGPVRFDSHFDSGAPVLFGYGPAGNHFAAYNVTTHLLRPIVFADSVTPKDILMPSPNSSVDIYLSAWVDHRLTDTQSHMYLYACDAALSCQATSVDRYGWVVGVVIDPEDATGRTLMGPINDWENLQWIYGWSADAGATFPVQVTVPSSSFAAQFQLIGPADGLTMYEETLDQTGAYNYEHLYRWTLDGHKDELSLPYHATEQQAIQIVPLTRERLLAYSYGTAPMGYWCSVDGGHTWQQDCPPDPSS